MTTLGSVREGSLFENLHVLVDPWIMDREFVRDAWHLFHGEDLITRMTAVIYVRFCWLAGSAQEDE